LVSEPGLLAATNLLRRRIRVSTVAAPSAFVYRAPHTLTDPGVTVSRERLLPTLLHPRRRTSTGRRTTSLAGQVRSLPDRISECHRSSTLVIHAHRRRRPNRDRRRMVAPLSGGVSPGATAGCGIRRISLQPQIPLVSALKNRLHEVHSRKLIADRCLQY